MTGLWKHQEEAIKNAEFLSGYGFFHQVGTGKTRSVIEVSRGKFKYHKRLLRTLIITPPITLHNWKREWHKFSKLKDEEVTILQGTGGYRLKTFKEKCFTEDMRLGQVVITNYESLLMKPLFDEIVRWQPELIILDEAHRIKSLTSKRTKACLKLGAIAHYRYILTGSPILNSILDIFPQMLFLDNGVSLGTNIWGFRGRFMRDKNANMPKQRYFPNWVTIDGAEKEIHNRIGHITSFVKKEECLDLPPLIEQDLFVELDPESRRMYDEMKKDFITSIKDKEIVATMALTKLLRLQQLASGFCRDVEGTDHSLKGNPKLETLKSLLEEICVGQKQKCIVWAAWRANYAEIERVCKELNLDYACLTGDTKANQRQVEVDRFCTGDASVCIANPGAAGIGINLIESSYSIWFSRTFSLEHEIQATARNYRGGSEIHERITRINLISKNTVDELIAMKLKLKEAIGVKVLEGIEGKI